MTQVTVKLNKKLDKVVGIVKSIQDLPSKDKAIQYIIEEKAKDVLDKKLRKEYINKILKLDKNGEFKEYKNVEQLEEETSNA